MQSDEHEMTDNQADGLAALIAQVVLDASLEAFTEHYITTALWSSVGGGEPGELTDEHSYADLSAELLERMRADCEAFYAANSAAIHCDGAPLANDFEGSIAEREAAMAGHDFWLTRCGHGAGFWDGDWPEPHATILDNAAKAFGNVDLYVGDDGQIYGM